jgi:hypothetical protein
LRRPSAGEKDILRPDDVERCGAVGADGVIIANHGGRQLDAAVSPLKVLAERRARISAPILINGGYRCGADIVKALALGANAVLRGRATLHGLAAAEERKYTIPATPARGRRDLGNFYGGFGGVRPEVFGGSGLIVPGGFGPFGPFPDHTTGIASVAFSPDGKFVLAGCMDNVLRIYELSTGKERKLEGHTQQVHGAVFTPDGKRILSGSYDQTVRLWDVESCNEVCRFFGHTNWAWGVAVSSDGKLGLSGSLDKTVRLWKLPK